MRRPPLRVRLTAFFTATLVAALCAFGAYVWWVEGRLGQQRVDRELDGRAATTGTVIANELAEGLSIADAAREAAAAVGAEDRAVAIFDPAGRTLASDGRDIAWQTAWTSDGGVVRRDVRFPDGAWRIRVARQTLNDRKVWLLQASSLRDVERQQREVLEALSVAIPVALLLAGGGGLWMATRTIRPIEDALRAQRQFMADASHELRTPVSIVRTTSDVGLSAAHREEHDYREALSIVSGQARRLSRLVESMLVLARADAGGYPIQRADLYLDEVVDECCRAVAVLCRERRVVIACGPRGELPFRGDEDLLRQMIVNLLTNAVQHSPPGGVVRIAMSQADGGTTISIEDAGPGIPAGDQQRIFDRFVRLDPARSGTGAGLGLPIARWVAEAHGGTLRLMRSGPDGSTFTIALPSVGAAA